MKDLDGLRGDQTALPTTLADIIDAKRSLRLELIVVFLIAFESW